MFSDRLKWRLFSLVFTCSLMTYGQTPALLKLDESYDEGIELFRKEQFGNAQLKFDGFVQANAMNSASEKNTSAEYYASMCAIKLFNKDAKVRVEAFAEKNSLSPLKNQLFIEFANYRFSTQRYREAHEYYDKVDQFRISQAQLNELQFKNGYSLLMEEKNKEAKKLFFKLKDKDSKYSNSARYYYAHILYSDSSYAEALTNFLPLQSDKDFSPFVPYYLAQIYYRLKDFDKLVEVGEDLIEKASEKRSIEIAKLLSDAFYKRDDYENCIKYMDLYEEKGGKLRHLDHFQKGFSHYKLSQYQGAIESFNKITSIKKPIAQNAYYHLGDCYIKINAKKKAITAFKAASEMEFSEQIAQDAFFNYAKLAYEFADPYQDAITTLNLFLKKYPESNHKTEVNEYLANLYLTTKDYDRALLALKKVGLNSPNMQEIYQKISFYRATEIFNSLRYVEALSRYKESLKYPINIKVAALSQYWIAECHYRLKKYDKALVSMDKFRKMPGVINLDEYGRSYYQSAYCYYKDFDFQKAASYFRTFTRDANKKDPRLSDAYLRMADCHFLTEGYIKASEHYATAIQLKSKNSDYAFFQRAECMGLLGKRDQKISELEKLIKKFPNSDYVQESKFEIAETYLRLENYQNALLSFQNFIADYPNTQSTVIAKMRIGLIFSNTDQNQKAIASFREVVQTYPGSDQSIEAVGLARLVYARENRIEEYLDWVENLSFVNFEKSTLDSTAYEVAFDLFTEGDCDKAILAFNNYLGRFDKGLFVLKSNYYLAQCAARMEDKDLEIQSYTNISRLPINTYSPQAFLYLAHHSYDTKDYALALDRYQRLLNLGGDRMQKLRASAGIMRSAYKLGDYASSAKFGIDVNNLNTDNAELKIEVVDIIASSYLKLEENDNAMMYFTDLAKIAEGEPKARAMYYQAELLYRMENLDSSEVMIYKLIEELPAFKEYKMKALILLAKNLWKKEDVFQANYTLDFVIKAEFKEDISKEAILLKEEIKSWEEQKQLELRKAQKAQRDSLFLDSTNDEFLLFDGEYDDEFDELEELEEISEKADTNIRKN